MKKTDLHYTKIHEGRETCTQASEREAIRFIRGEHLSFSFIDVYSNVLSAAQLKKEIHTNTVIFIKPLFLKTVDQLEPA